MLTIDAGMMNLWSKPNGSQAICSKKKHHHENSLNTNASSLTSATADLTCDGSIGDVFYSDARVKQNLYINTSVYDEEVKVQDLTTPNLLQRVDCTIGRISNALTPCSSRVTQYTAVPSLMPSNNVNETVPSAANDVFHRIMNKYNQMPIGTSASLDVQSLSSASLELQVTNKHFSDLLRQQALDNGTISVIGSVRFTPSFQHQDQSGVFTLSSHHMLKKIESKESTDVGENYIAYEVRFDDDDDVSTLTTNTFITIGSVSFCSGETEEIQSHVKFLVRVIAAEELRESSSMMKQLEDALVSKARLESRVVGIERQMKNYEFEVKEAEIIADLARKAAELKSCLETALIQAKESKQRATKFAENILTQEIKTLRSEFEQALARGVHIDSTSQNALILIESNQKGILHAAESDAKKTVRMKMEIEIFFLRTVDHVLAEFEKWANDQMTDTSNGKNMEDEAKLLEIKYFLESVMSGMTPLYSTEKCSPI